MTLFAYFNFLTSRLIIRNNHGHLLLDCELFKIYKSNDTKAIDKSMCDKTRVPGEKLRMNLYIARGSNPKCEKQGEWNNCTTKVSFEQKYLHNYLFVDSK